jgi:dihydroorotate dehydrogenase electron transfer subunit
MADLQPREHAAPLRVTGEVFALKTVGDHIHLTLVAPGVPDRVRPGMFVTLGVGGEPSGLLFRRAFWLHRVRPSGVYGGTIEVVFEVRGPGTRWLSRLHAHDPVDVVGPSGRPFALPKEPVACAVVGDGHGAVPMFMLGEHLRDRGCSVHMVLGAANERGLFGALEARRAAQSVTVATLDGSVGLTGTVAAALPAVLARNAIDVVYGCGPNSALAAVAEVARAAGAWCQVAVEAPMACGHGLCESCIVPVRGRDGLARWSRCCTDGPVYAADRVDWGRM